MGIIARQSLKASISNYIGVFLAFLNVFVLFPKFYEASDLGAIRLVLEIGAVISGFALLGTNYSINRYFPYFRTADQRHHGFFFWAFAIPALGFTLALTGLVIFKDNILAQYENEAALLNYLYPALLVLVLFTLYQAVLESCNANHGRIAVPNFFREVLLRCIILFAGFLFYLDLVSFTTSVWLMVVAYGIVAVSNMYYLGTLTQIHLKPDILFIKANRKMAVEAIKFTGYLCLGGAANLLISKIDFIFISVQKDLTQTAIYSVGFYLALMIEIPKRTILQIANPIISQRIKENNMAEVEKTYKSITLNQLLAASVLFYLIWINIDNLYQIMPQGDTFKAGKMVVFIIGMGKLIDMVGSAGGPIMANSRYYYLGLFNFLISAVVAVSSNYLLIPYMGINGAALATVFTYALSEGALLWIIYRKDKIHPFTWNHLKVLIILAIFLIPTFFGKWIENPFLDGFVRTLVLGLPMVAIIYRLQVSVEFNQTVQKILARAGMKLPF